MANPKYKNLPFLAVGEPDVYETGDLPEVDQAILQDEHIDSSVERIHLDPKAAFRNFNRSALDGSCTDFSDRVSKFPSRHGYSVQYEILPESERAEETLLQRLQRLKCEIKEIEDAAKTNFAEPQMSPSTILSEVEKLQKHIDDFSVATSNSSAIADSSAYHQLLSQLTSKKQYIARSKEVASGKPDAITYELHVNPGITEASKLASLEARLSQLENVIGNRTEKFTSLSDASGAQSLMDSVSVISAKLQLFDDEKVDKLTARLQLLLQSLSKVKESLPVEAHNMETINAMYELLKKWDANVDSLPVIVDRLYILQDLHQQAMEFTANLRAMETAQAELSKKLETHSQLLHVTNESFDKNVAIIKANVGNLERRMANLKK